MQRIVYDSGMRTYVGYHTKWNDITKVETTCADVGTCLVCMTLNITNFKK